MQFSWGIDSTHFWNAGCYFVKIILLKMFLLTPDFVLFIIPKAELHKNNAELVGVQSFLLLPPQTSLDRGFAVVSLYIAR